MLTDDRNDPRLKEGQKNETGQHSIYLVLSEEERAKGFVRPLRRAYIHVGRKLRGEIVMLDEPKEINGKWYVALDEFEVDGKKAGAYITQKEVDSLEKTGYRDGCGTRTEMGLALCETYARNPKFYSSTFCAGCNRHLPVHEFVWAEDGEIVGS